MSAIRILKKVSLLGVENLCTTADQTSSSYSMVLVHAASVDSAIAYHRKLNRALENQHLIIYVIHLAALRLFASA